MSICHLKCPHKHMLVHCLAAIREFVNRKWVPYCFLCSKKLNNWDQAVRLSSADQICTKILSLRYMLVAKNVFRNIFSLTVCSIYWFIWTVYRSVIRKAPFSPTIYLSIYLSMKVVQWSQNHSTARSCMSGPLEQVHLRLPLVELATSGLAFC